MTFATSAVTLGSYFLKFSLNIPTSRVAVSSYFFLSAQVLRGLSTSPGTPAQLVGISSPKKTSFSKTPALSVLIEYRCRRRPANKIGIVDSMCFKSRTSCNIITFHFPVTLFTLLFSWHFSVFRKVVSPGNAMLRVLPAGQEREQPLAN